MRLKQWIRWIRMMLMMGSMVVLVACSTHKKNDQSAINDANAAYESGTQASGLGEESGFNDQAGSQRSASSRIYYFDFDSNVVHSSDQPAILANANYLASHPRARVLLEGYTDPRGSREYNIGLGERRAKAVAAMMTANGVSSAQIRIISYGAEKPASPGRTETDYQLDRRVVLVYLQR